MSNKPYYTQLLNNQIKSISDFLEQAKKHVLSDSWYLKSFQSTFLDKDCYAYLSGIDNNDEGNYM